MLATLLLVSALTRRQRRHARSRGRGALVILALSATCVAGVWALFSSGTDDGDRSGSLRYSNPVFGEDFADPDVLLVGDRYYGFATNTASSNVPVLVSRDLRRWRPQADALPTLPSWAGSAPLQTWSPAVRELSGRWVLLVTVQHRASSRQCIAIAEATRAAGPYEPASEPLICQVELGGSIDPFLYSEGGRAWVLWKNDGNCCGTTVEIWSQELDPRNLQLIDEPRSLIGVDQRWERAALASQSTVEAPALLRTDGRYLLFYSGNGYSGAGYAIGYAVCESPRGPCEKPTDQPLVHTTANVTGPGGATPFRDANGRLWLAYHAWDPRAVGYENGGQRSLRIDPLIIDEGVPRLIGPSTDVRDLDA